MGRFLSSTWRVFLGLSFAFYAGWQVAHWQSDSQQLRQTTHLQQQTQQALDNATKSAKALNQQLATLHNEALMSIRNIANETQKPVFHTPCVTDKYVSLLNTHIRNTERILSGGRVVTVQDHTASTKGE